MSDSKAKSKSVSMPLALWLVVEAHAKSQHLDRSSYLRGLAIADLTKAGVLPPEGGDSRQAEWLAVCARAAERGVDVARVLTDALEARLAAEASTSAA